MFHRMEQTTLAKNLDVAVRWAIPFGVYPGVIVFSILFLLQDDNGSLITLE